MKAVRIHDYGGPEVLQYEEVPDPVPSHEEVLVQVRACALNHLDLDLRSGISRFPLSLPHILGIEFSGEITAIGAAVEGLSVGDRVVVAPRRPCLRCRECHAGRQNKCLRMERFGLTRPGGYAELAAVPSDLIIPLSSSIGFDEAAAIQVAFSTAWRMLVSLGELRPGETVLIQAVGSGIGSAALQVAKLAGAFVIGTAGSDEKIQKAGQFGLDVGINYRREDFVKRVMEATNGSGVDLVFEHIGGEVFLNSLLCLRPQGRIVVGGAHSGEVVGLDLVEFFRLEARLFGMTSATMQEIRTVMALAAKGKIHPIVDRVFPLAEAREAHAYLESRNNFGKVILKP